MKIAAISDVHGNLAALDAVLADIQRRGADVVVNLGDSFSGPLFPAPTADRLIPLQLPTIRGNHERQLLTLPVEAMGASDRHAAQALRPEHRVWMAALPEMLRLTDDVLLVHGIPASDYEYFLETVTQDGVRAATRAEVEERADGVEAALILCGHSHIPRVFVLGDRCLIVNPGSVGLQAFEHDHVFPHTVEVGAPDARYAIVERHNGAWRAELVAVPYDAEPAALAAEREGRSDWARALRTGRL